MLAQDLPLRADRVVGGRERIGRRLLQPGSLNLIRTRSGIAVTLGRAESRARRCSGFSIGTITALPTFTTEPRRAPAKSTASDGSLFCRRWCAERRHGVERRPV